MQDRILINAIGDGNCAFNAFALGLTDLIVQGKFDEKKHPSISKEITEAVQNKIITLFKVNKILDSNNLNWSSIKNYLSQQNTYEKQKAIQLLLAKPLRILAYELNIANVQSYASATFESLSEEYERFIKNKFKSEIKLGDIYTPCKPIRLEFERRFKEYFGNGKSEYSAEYLEKSKAGLSVWWGLNELESTIGVEAFLNYVKEDGKWAGDLELKTLANYFNINLNVMAKRFNSKPYAVHFNYGVVTQQDEPDVFADEDLLSIMQEREIIDQFAGKKISQINFLAIASKEELNRLLADVPKFEEIIAYLYKHSDKDSIEVPNEFLIDPIKQVLIARSIIHYHAQDKIWIFNKAIELNSLPFLLSAVEETKANIIRILYDKYYQHHPVIELVNESATHWDCWAANIADRWLQPELKDETVASCGSFSVSNNIPKAAAFPFMYLVKFNNELLSLAEKLTDGGNIANIINQLLAFIDNTNDNLNLIDIQSVNQIKQNICYAIKIFLSQFASEADIPEQLKNDYKHWKVNDNNINGLIKACLHYIRSQNLPLSPYLIIAYAQLNNQEIVIWRKQEDNIKPILHFKPVYATKVSVNPLHLLLTTNEKGEAEYHQLNSFVNNRATVRSEYISIGDAVAESIIEKPILATQSSATLMNQIKNVPPGLHEIIDEFDYLFDLLQRKYKNNKYLNDTFEQKARIGVMLEKAFSILPLLEEHPTLARDLLKKENHPEKDEGVYYLQFYRALMNLMAAYEQIFPLKHLGKANNKKKVKSDKKKQAYASVFEKYANAKKYLVEAKKLSSFRYILDSDTLEHNIYRDPRLKQKKPNDESGERHRIAHLYRGLFKTPMGYQVVEYNRETSIYKIRDRKWERVRKGLIISAAVFIGVLFGLAVGFGAFISGFGLIFAPFAGAAAGFATGYATYRALDQATRNWRYKKHRLTEVRLKTQDFTSVQEDDSRRYKRIIAPAPSLTSQLSAETASTTRPKSSDVAALYGFPEPLSYHLKSSAKRDSTKDKSSTADSYSKPFDMQSDACKSFSGSSINETNILLGMNANAASTIQPHHLNSESSSEASQTGLEPIKAEIKSVAQNLISQPAGAQFKLPTAQKATIKDWANLAKQAQLLEQNVIKFFETYNASGESELNKWLHNWKEQAFGLLNDINTKLEKSDINPNCEVQLWKICQLLATQMAELNELLVPQQNIDSHDSSHESIYDRLNQAKDKLNDKLARLQDAVHLTDVTDIASFNLPSMDKFTDEYEGTHAASMLQATRKYRYENLNVQITTLNLCLKNVSQEERRNYILQIKAINNLLNLPLAKKRINFEKLSTAVRKLEKAVIKKEPKQLIQHSSWFSWFSQQQAQKASSADLQRARAEELSHKFV